MTDSRFVRLLWIHLALTVALTAASVAAIFFPSYSDTLAVAYENEPENGLLGNVLVSGIVLVPLFLAWLTGLVGLFFFKRWARSLSLYVTLFGLIISAFLGPFLYSGLEASLFDASSILWGFILALSYYSSISARFEG